MVVLVISVLTGLVLGIAGLANNKAATSKAKGELQTLATEFEEYRLAQGLYPTQTTNDNWGHIETNLIKEISEKVYGDDVIVDIPQTDPWGNEYEYRIPNRQGYQLELRSKGPDGRSGGEFEVDNINYE